MIVRCPVGPWSVEPPFRCLACDEPMLTEGADQYWRQRFSCLWWEVHEAARFDIMQQGQQQ